MQDIAHKRKTKAQKFTNSQTILFYFVFCVNVCVCVRAFVRACVCAYS